MGHGRARRIKCDETKPDCKRCSVLKRQCEGYPSREITTANTQLGGQSGLAPFHGGPSASRPPVLVESKVCFAISDGFCKHPEQERLARLGCSILAQDRYRDLGSGMLIWNQLLPQLSHAIPCVNAAAAALGAIYESTLLRGASSWSSNRRAAMHYGLAIRHVQREVSSQLHGPVPLLLCCALLAFVELLRHRQSAALMHLQGALKLLSSRDLVRGRTPHSAVTNADTTNDATRTTVEDNLSLMFMTLDIQKASYVLGQPPVLGLATKHQSHGPRNFRNIGEAELELVRLIHSCYHFTAHASEFKYLPRAAIPSDLVFEQGQHIAKLSTWLDNLNQSFLPVFHDSVQKLPPESYCHALVLRSQCLSTLVYLCGVLDARECSYDHHGPKFQRIVQDATVAIARGSEGSSGLWRFRPCPGIIQPLFLTAIKYRHPDCRRRAIDLLDRSGREGPFDGKLLAAVARRLAGIEEAQYPSPLPGNILPGDIAEDVRVHGCGMDAEAKDDEPMHSVKVTFSQCLDVDQMISGPEVWDHSSNWAIWTEVVSF